MLMVGGMTGQSSVCLWWEACRGGVVYAYGGRHVEAEKCVLMEGGV